MPLRKKIKPSVKTVCSGSGELHHRVTPLTGRTRLARPHQAGGRWGPPPQGPSPPGDAGQGLSLISLETAGGVSVREGHSGKSMEETLRPHTRPLCRPHRTPRRPWTRANTGPHLVGAALPSRRRVQGEAWSLGQRTRPPRLRQLLELLNFKVSWFLVAVGHCGFPGAGNPEIITPIRYVVL